MTQTETILATLPADHPHHDEIKAALTFYADHDPATGISLHWCIDDVLGMDGGDGLTPEQAKEILDYVEVNHDYNHGVSWETLQAAADELYPEAER